MPHTQSGNLPSEGDIDHIQDHLKQLQPIVARGIHFTGVTGRGQSMGECVRGEDAKAGGVSQGRIPKWAAHQENAQVAARPTSTLRGRLASLEAHARAQGPRACCCSQSLRVCQLLPTHRYSVLPAPI